MLLYTPIQLVLFLVTVPSDASQTTLNLVKFFQDLLKCLDSPALERDHHAITIFQKAPVQLYTSESALYHYQIPMNEYHYALECLQKIVEMWEKGKHVAVKIIDDDQNAHIPPYQSQPPVTMNMPSTTSNIPLDVEHHGPTLQLPPLHSQPPVTSDMPPTTSHTPLTHLSPNQSHPSTMQI